VIEASAGHYDPRMFSLRLIYLAMGAATAALYPFVPVILADRGLGPVEIGVVGSVGACGLIAAIFVWGHLGDRVLGRRTTLQLCALAAAGVAGGIALPVPPVVLGGLVVAFACTQGVLLALVDAVAVNRLTDPGRQYGRVRLLASLSFAVTTIAVGFVYDRVGFTIASAVYAAFAVTIATAAFGCSDDRPRGHEHGAAPTTSRPWPSDTISRFGSTGAAFKAQPRLLPVLATVAVTWLAIVVSFVFLSLRIVDIGGQSSDVALSFGVSAFAEIPGMFLATRLAPRIGLRGVFSVSSLLFGLAFLSWAILDSPTAIVATRVATGLSYGGLTVAMVLTIGTLLPADLQATGQSLYQGTATGVSAIVGNVGGGVAYASVGAPALFVGCAALCAVGGLLALVTLPRHGEP
jgi:PPP family 3-phenylpropionic acid transporter